MAKPVVGVPADRRIVEPHPFHMVGEKYLIAVTDGADALPLMIPVLADDIDVDSLLDGIDGLMLTGSPSNVEPHHYGGEAAREGTMADPHRDALTLPLGLAAIERGIPVLAICRGFQELNVIYGGTLSQHVHELPGFNDHRENPDDPLDVQYGPAHPLKLTPGGLLNRMSGESEVIVNSIHGQGIDRLADGLTVEGVADDGLVEAFTVDSASGFTLAVQWHPEWRATENEFSMQIFKLFGDACRERQQSRYPAARATVKAGSA